jgi:hypothetical protein
MSKNSFLVFLIYHGSSSQRRTWPGCNKKKEAPVAREDRTRRDSSRTATPSQNTREKKTRQEVENAIRNPEIKKTLPQRQRRKQQIRTCGFFRKCL